VHYDYTEARRYCEQLGLTWFGDDYLVNVDTDAYKHGFRQDQVDVAMRHALWHIRNLFDAKSYPFRTRCKLALHFLLGRSPRAF
jgi:hypothetical protein